MSEYLDLVEAQLTELTEKGAHQRLRARRPRLPSRGTGIPGPDGQRPPRRRNEALAFLAAAAVVVAVVAIVLVNVHSGKPQRTSAAAARTGTPTATAATGRASTAPYTVTQTTTASAPPAPTLQAAVVHGDQRADVVARRVGAVHVRWPAATVRRDPAHDGRRHNVEPG